MEDQQLLRYSRQIMLPELDIVGQEKLVSARVLIIGLGGLGSPLAMYLTAAGVGHLVLSDPDVVELSNLQRQIIHTSEDIGRGKTLSAEETLRKLNPEVVTTQLPMALSGKRLIEEIKQADVVADASDNFKTRFELNKHCVATRTPLVSAAAIRFEGQLSVFNTQQSDSPCYRCLYDDNEDTRESCSQTGVIAPLLGIMGSLQANEVIKLLAGIGRPLLGKLLLLDCLNMELHQAALSKDPNCPVCSAVIPV